MRPSDRDRYNGNNFDSRYPDERVNYDRNQGYRGGGAGGGNSAGGIGGGGISGGGIGGHDTNRDFKPWDQSYRYVRTFDTLDWLKWNNYYNPNH